MVSLEFFGPELLEDPYPSYRRLLEADEPQPFEGLPLWLLARYDHVLRALRTPDAFSSAAFGGMGPNAVRSLISADPPDHTTLRRLVQKPFTPSGIAALEPRIRQIAEDLVDAMLAKGEPDIVGDLGYPLPVIVIAELLGIPIERREEFKRWSDEAVSGMDDAMGSLAMMATGSTEAFAERRGADGAGVSEMSDFFADVIEERRRNPGEDLISMLVTGSEPLTLAELVSFCTLLLIAGNETTTNLVSNAALALFAHPDAAERLWADPALVPQVLEETLRYDSPVQLVARLATTDVEFDGVTIPSGAFVVVMTGAANRDPRHYERPDAFDIDRNPRDHVAFGSGVHLCLGAPLARLEGKVLFETLLARTRSMTPAGES